MSPDELRGAYKRYVRALPVLTERQRQLTWCWFQRSSLPYFFPPNSYSACSLCRTYSFFSQRIRMGHDSLAKYWSPHLSPMCIPCGELSRNSAVQSSRPGVWKKGAVASWFSTDSLWLTLSFFDSQLYSAFWFALESALSRWLPLTPFVSLVSFFLFSWERRMLSRHGDYLWRPMSPTHARHSRALLVEMRLAQKKLESTSLTEIMW